MGKNRLQGEEKHKKSLVPVSFKLYEECVSNQSYRYIFFLEATGAKTWYYCPGPQHVSL